MSTWMGVALERGRFPRTLVPETGDFGDGTAILRCIEQIEAVTKPLGLVSITRFICDRNPLTRQVTGEFKADPARWGVVGVPARDWGRRIQAEVQRRLVWFEAAEGLAAVVALLPHVDPLLGSGSDYEKEYMAASIRDLRAFERRLAYAAKKAIRFNFDVSY